MDLVLGGAIEIASPAVKKFAKDLSERLGRTVTDEEAFDILQEKKREYIATNKDISEEEREKLLRELAEESNRRKGKSVANAEVFYGNSTRMPVADLPEPKGNKTGLYQMEGDYGVDLKGELPTPNELMAKQLRQIEGPRNITRATEEDFNNYIKAGSKKSAKKKAEAKEEGRLLFLGNDEEIDDFIIDSIEGKKKDNTYNGLYGKTPKRLADDVYRMSNGECNIYDKWIELPSSDINHSFKEHRNPKEVGDIPLSIKHWLKVPEYIDGYSEVIEVAPIKGGFRIKVGKRINGYSVISEIFSEGRDGLAFKNLWGNTTEKYLEEKAKARPYTGRSTAKNAHNPTAGLSDGALDNNIGDSAQNVNTSSPKIEPILPVEEMVERQMKGKKPLKEMNKAEREKLLRELAEESNRRKEKPDTWKPVEEHIEEIRKMEPAAIIEHPQFNMREGLIEKVADYFSAIGNKVRRDDIGDVLISRRGIKDSFAHGMTEEKAKAFEAVPEVIRKGKIIGEQQNWKGRGYDTALIVGNAKIEDATKPIGVIIKRDKKSNRYYMHEVLDLDEIKTGKEFSPGPSADGLPGSQPVVNSNIADSVQNVNTPQAKSGRKKQKALKEMNKAEQFYAANVDNLYGAGRVNAA